MPFSNQQLGSLLWGIADTGLRGKVEDYKAYILSLLFFKRLSDADKAEKIIRDIETVIRREEARNPAYADLGERLQEIIRRKDELKEEIGQILADLFKLYGEVDEIGNLPKRMGFEDRGRYDLFLDIKHKTGTAFDETKARQFADILEAGLCKALYAGWQESELKRKETVTDIKALADGDKFASLGISDNADLVETLLKRLIQHYAIE
jgi:type I restriction enzyme, R subunit